jgi:WD40 repeat protein/DNA-binding CsgD family transcriptional regulator
MRVELPVALDTVLETATAKEPSARYPDAVRMASAYNALIEIPRRVVEQSLAEPLTDRELEILQLMVGDLDNSQIAERLVVTIGTVRWHVKQIFGKLDVHSRAQAIERARELRLTETRLSDSLVRAVAALPEAPLPLTVREIPPGIAPSTLLENPYKGLRAFQEADAPDFFGREALVQQLFDRLAEDHPLARFLAVVGPSGSGKSSVVRAGLIPALRAGRLPGSERWFVTDMLPGTHPFEELEAALNRIAARAGTPLLALLCEEERGLARAVKHILPPDGGEVLLVIDQFEELFTLLDDEVARVSFLESVRAAVTDPRAHLRVILTLRADFYDRPLRYGAFAELMRTQTEVIVPLNGDELRQAVTGPADRIGLVVEPALIQALVDEVASQPGALPLFQYALTEAFERRQDHTLTLKAHQAIGGLSGALARRADDVYAGLGAGEQVAGRQLFLRLVTLGEGVEDTRRRVLESELLALGDAEAMQSAVDAFDRARLLSFDRDPRTRGPTVEVAHEALLREWTRLRNWLDESRADVRTQRLLASASAEWSGANCDPSYLLHGSRLAQVSAWAEGTDVALTADERAYLAASVRAERRAVTLRRRVRRAVAGISLLVAVVMTVLAVLATSREQQALREAAVNHSLVLANEAEHVFDNGRTDLGLALALEAVAIDQPPARAIQALRTVAQGMGTRAVLRSQGNAVKAVAFSPDSRLALSGGCATLIDSTCREGELIVWDLATATDLRRLEGHTGWISSVAFDPTRPEIALSASEDGTLILWNVEKGEIVRRFEGHTAGVNSLAFSADGSMALSGSDDRIAILWDVATGRIMRRFSEHRAPVTAVALSPDQRLAATGADSADSNVLLWDVESGEVLHTLVGPTSEIVAVGFRTDEQGQMLVYAISKDNVYREWNTDTGMLVRPVTVTGTLLGFSPLPDQRSAVECEGHVCLLLTINTWKVINQLITPLQSQIVSNAVSADGRLALFGSLAGEVILANLSVANEVRRFQTERGLATVDISPDGRYLLTGEFDSGTVILWDVQTGQEIRRLEGLASLVASVKFSPGGQLALICSLNVYLGIPGGKATLWEVETGRVIHEWDDFEYYPRTSAFSPDGQSVLIGTLQWGAAWPEEGVRGELVQYDLTSGQVIRRYGPTRTVLDISFSPDGRRAITGNSVYGYATLWDTATGQPIRRFEHYALAVSSTSDPRFFLLGSEGGFVFLVDAETGANVRSFSGPSSTYWSLDTDPSQKYLLGGGSHQNVLVLWDYATGLEVQRFQGHASATVVWNVVFSPDGQTAFSSALGPEEAVIQWRIVDMPLDDLRAWIAANRYVRDFTCEERAQYAIPPLCEMDAS